MIPKLPSSSDGSSIPPRQRPNLADLSQDGTEQNLWAFDDAEESGDSLEWQPQGPTPMPVEPRIPSPRREEKRVAPLEKESPIPEKAPENRERIKLDIVRNRKQTSTQTASVNSQNPDGEFGELDQWEDTGLPVAGEFPAAGAPEEEVLVTPEPAAAAAGTYDLRDEFTSPRSENNKRVSRLSLSKVEGVGLIFLLALLLIGGGVVFFNSIGRLPSGSELGQSKAFPVEGMLLTIERAESSWREPSAADTVRRGTQLFPVLNLTVSGGPAVLRVFFRDGDGKVVGDAVSRSVVEAGDLEIAATAGFEEAWMHDTYSTSGGAPWTIEILEGPSQGASAAEFKTLLKLNVSTGRR